MEIFLNAAALLRLAAAEVIEAHDASQVTRRYLSDVSMDELRAVIVEKHARAALANNTKSPGGQHDALIATRKPRLIRSPPILGTLSRASGRMRTETP